MSPKEHNRTLGILFLAYLAMQLLGFIVGVIAIAVMMLSMMDDLARSGGLPVGVMFAIFAVAFLISFLLLIPIGIAGFKLLKERPNARIWAIVASAISLLNIPLGTALGIYGLWFTCGEQGKAFYFGQSQPTMFPPPPPNSWQ